MMHLSIKERVLQIIIENRDLLHPDSQKSLNMKFLLSDERLQHLSPDTLIEIVNQLNRSGKIRYTVKHNPEEDNKVVNFAIREIY
ncbi:TPA: hypothetical protein ACR3Z0_006355 [Bacillus thuringiensis]|uniref:Uncharacterized protein n=1 Tax=Bacillus thuringiensis TaxID=1428 RepID=A0A9X6KZW0_BACTU|nr:MULTISPECIES: hypothetical protein [Bacillus cereus group]ETE99458.1 hypothetical protein C623_0204145 [Bacillus thuringiensis serovar aizawai str. Hu4-2]KAB1378307.1 hypothetical protein FPG93_19340 [Bacillus thuringiensis]KMP95009.1 hypothetical protein TU66_31450 [Bacillus cereus]MCC3874469.1 hypothetical protein [Bacillus thuringiensis]MCC3880756.1 hypothetical protein [Bacillus thuringiensis]